MLFRSEEIYYGKEKISLRQGCDVTINGGIYVFALEECIRADRKEEKGDIGVTSIVFYFDSNDVGFPHEKVKEHGIYVFTKEDQQGFYGSSICQEVYLPIVQPCRDLLVHGLDPGSLVHDQLSASRGQDLQYSRFRSCSGEQLG